MKESPVKIDVLLEPLTRASEERADELLSQLITNHAEPVIKGVIRFKLRLNPYRETQRAETDDIHQEVVLQLLAQLQRFRKLPEGHPISDLRGMAAVIAHRTCARWMRRQFPERHALKNRLHYLLTRQRGLALWDEDGKSLAGFAVWQKENKPAKAARHLSDVEGMPNHIRTLRSDKPQELADAVAAILNHVGGPVEFDELVSAIATIQGISDQPIESLAEDDDGASLMPATPEPDQAWRMEKDGGRVLTLDQEGKLSGADDLPANYRNLVTKALSTQRIEKSSQLQGLTRPPSSLMSSDNQKDQFSVLQPAGDVLLTDKPTFRWTTLDGATGYVVEVYNDKFNLVSTSPQLSNSSWTTTLPRGNVYSWQVKAIKDGQEIASPRPPAPQAKFRVLDQTKANEFLAPGEPTAHPI